MKPRTQFEKEVVASNMKLTTITNKAIDWAIRTQVEHLTFRTAGSKCTCGDCGQSFNYEGKGKSVKCPHCAKRVKVVDTKKRSMERAAYFNTTEVIDGMQVVRTYLLNVYMKKGMPSTHEVMEVSRLWLNAKGQTAVTAKRRSMFGYCDSFVTDSAIELRSQQDMYNIISDSCVYPHFSLIPELRRNGLKASFPDCHPFFMMNYLLTDSKMETLMKGGHSKAVAFYTTNHHRLERDWNSLKVAFRQGYHPEDYTAWSDMIAMLDKLGRDTRSPKYICPDNLKVAHDRWSAKLQEQNRRQREKEEQEKARKEEAKFAESKSRYFGIIIKDSELTISVLDSVEAYREEGTAMHHCVFACSYYTLPDSIVLSARDREGNRIETVEFSLKKGKVIQSRGVCNRNTEHHDRIVNLVNANADIFMKARATA